jgi:ADP-ribose pyrophosphatase YjhB (NUDIX family)
LRKSVQEGGMTGDGDSDGNGQAAGQRGPRVRTVPEGDDRERLICPDCDWIVYENPKIVVGAVVHHGGRILLCKRAIAPRKGFWTLPAGYLELNETVVDGAAREAWEEARARIEIEGLLAVYSITRISQIQLIHRARLVDPAIDAGPESEQVGLFAWDEIPWDAIAFPSVVWALTQYRDSADGPLAAPYGNPAGAAEGLPPDGRPAGM